MPLYRGEVQQGHPKFAPDSDAACIPRDGPVPIDAPDIAYTAEDNEAIHDFLRNTSKSSITLVYRRADWPQVNTTWHSVRIYTRIIHISFHSEDRWAHVL